ncbi:predicted protein [Plenodomus lingam JN3]|uniref:Predicted protein n=1 Tax=Leptosphaeria maculans (strain JN3 / isolate v23.1.3 / race Av1-4-5-6-7-8) TaxID=985895 RepID=E4ZUL5_LEPMJ|nr:predicted protein [Plenodomus lingam JN3]CBX95094.1 predicted protein [Plenodomus lingam JN3]
MSLEYRQVTSKFSSSSQIAYGATPVGHTGCGRGVALGFLQATGDDLAAATTLSPAATKSSETVYSLIRCLCCGCLGTARRGFTVDRGRICMHACAHSENLARRHAWRRCGGSNHLTRPWT